MTRSMLGLRVCWISPDELDLIAVFVRISVLKQQIEKTINHKTHQEEHHKNND